MKHQSERTVSTRKGQWKHLSYAHSVSVEAVRLAHPATKGMEVEAADAQALVEATVPATTLPSKVNAAHADRPTTTPIHVIF